MGATQKWTDPGTTGTTVLSTELNSLANNAAATSTTGYDNRNASNLNQYATFFFDGDIATAPVADLTLDLYAVYSPDGGTTYEDASATRPPAGGLLGSFVLDNATAQFKGIHGVMLQPFMVKFMLVNKSGYALAASGNTVKMYPFNNQVG